MDREEYNYWLSNINGVGAVKIEKLLEIFGNAERVFHSTAEELKRCTELSDTNVRAILGSRNIEKIHAGYANLISGGIYFVSKEDDRYPDRLRHIYGAPFSLYVKGRIPENNEKTIAIVGARECTAYGREMALYFARNLAAEGISVISGLARGIDSYAHEGALEAGGRTYGILGCGIDICYPRENIGMYIKMQGNGGIITEFSPGIQPLSCNFPMRNRIISALSDGILVVEAREKSGSLITVDMGLDQGKNIYAVPGRVRERLSEGCNNLIKMGAKLVTTPGDILEDYFGSYTQNAYESKKNHKLLESDGKIVYANLSLEPKHIEMIAMETKLPLDTVMEQLLFMELQGLVKQPMKNYYIVNE